LDVNLLDQIHARLDQLSRAERQVADVVLADPHQVIHVSMAHLAATSGVSEPSVLRFCRAVGCGGFQEFKVRLAQSLVTRPYFVHAGIAPTDPADVYSLKVLDSTIDTLIRMRDVLDRPNVERAVDALAAAAKHGRIEFYGFGASGAVAIDATCKFFFLVRPCFAYSDAHMQYLAASTLGPQDVAVAISHTGRTRELLESVELARSAGATVIAITAAGSPLAQAASIVLAAEIPEETDVYTPSISRIVHLLFVDVLAVGVALRFGRETEQRVGTMKSVLRAKRVEGGESLVGTA